MAKGNDGNLLQHWVEAALASRLHRAENGRRFHVVLTHGMAPFEPFEPRKHGTSGYKRLERCLALASRELPADAPAVVNAYKRCGASATHYPNSAEILAAVVGRANLRGSVTECDAQKFETLAARWKEEPLRIIKGSWRASLDQHACPVGLGHPWLLSMDPMTFLRDAEGDEAPDDANLRPSDLALLAPLFSSYLGSGQPGAVAVFCFSLRRKPGFDFHGLFSDQIAGIAKTLGCHHCFCEVPLQNRHVGGVLSMDDALLRDVKAEWDAHCAG